MNKNIEKVIVEMCVVATVLEIEEPQTFSLTSLLTDKSRSSFSKPM